MRTLLLTLCFWSTISAAAKFPLVVDPVVNATPPGATVSAGYLTLVNETSTEIIITGAYSPTITKVEIHRSIIKNDVATMELQKSVSLAPGAAVVFTHGDYHLMLMELTEPLTAGQSVDIILSTSVGDMLIEMPVRKLGMPMDENKHSKTSESADSDKATSTETTETEAMIEENHQTNTNGEEKVSSK